MIFFEQNPKICLFDIYHSSWKFLMDSPKFTSITSALTSAPAMDDKKKEPAVWMKVNTSQLLETPVTHTNHPIGNKTSKRREEREKILNVSVHHCRKD
jgi:hypothetical protein